MSRKNLKNALGFTLIELMIAIGIIAVLAGIVMIAVGRSRDKGQDAKVQEVLSSVRSIATSEFSDVGSFSNVCSSGKVYDTITALSQSIQLSGSYGCAADSDKYVVLFPLKTKNGYWCIDSLGSSQVVSDNNASISAKNCLGDSSIGATGGGGGGGGGLPPGGPVIPAALSASAGGDQAITLPSNTANLLGTVQGGSGTYTYAWSKLSGGTATITSASSASTSVTGLAAGSYTFRLTVNDGTTTVTDDMNISVNTNPGTSYGGTPKSIPGTIQAEDFNNGGENVAYHDTDPNNATGVYRPTDGVDLETTSDAGGGYNIGWINNGEWMKYNVDVATTGWYMVQLRVAAVTGGAQVQVEMDGNVVATLNVPTTNGWQNWQTISAPNISLTAGSHVMRVTSVTGNYNLNYIAFQEIQVQAGDVPASRTLDVRGPVSVPLMGPYANFYYYESLPRGYYNDPTKKWPLLIMMHGAGENPPQPISTLLRNGPLKWVSEGNQLEFTVNGKTETFVIMEPQTDWWHPFLVDRAVEYGKSSYNIDPTRVYLTGLSMGSQATLIYSAFATDYSNAYSKKIAAIGSVDGVFSNVPDNIYTPNDPDGAFLNYCFINSSPIATWLFSSSGHRPEWMTEMRDRLNACNPAPTPALKYTYYPNTNGAWDRAYDPSHTYENPNLYEWLLSQHR